MLRSKWRLGLLTLMAITVLIKTDAVSLPVKIKIVVVFGYKDTRPARLVGDRYERAMLVDRLVKLGFHRNPKDDDELSRKLENQNGMMMVRVVHSSVGPDDDENRKDPYQRYQSKAAHDSFISAIGNTDVILYDGHSRDGGGPDFEPPRFLANGHVDYAWYRQNQVSFKELIRVWKKSEIKPRELGLISCYSSQHFSKKMEIFGTKLTTISSLIYYTDALEKMLEIIRGYLNKN